ncbi:MAG TPA: hypothetical protein VFI41_05180 [Gemmatimonadales bacterium]|nr:hypothetical protein [Gemmatimonadales bacterium]
MGLRRKLTTLEQETKAAKRIAALATHELPPQVEHCLYLIGRSLVDFGRDGAPEHVLEALSAAEVSVEILKELRRRVESEIPR